MARTIDIFFYGLFMDPQALRNKGLNPIAPRKGRVEGMALQIGERATLLPNAGECAYGVVIGLTHHELDQLYADAGVAAYRPEAVIAILEDSKIVPALCFNLPPDSVPGEANSHYAAELRAVAQHMGLPRNYVESIS